MTRVSILTVAIFLAPSIAGSQALERINPAGLSEPRTYTHVVKAGKLLFIAGQVGVDEKGTLVDPGMVEQLSGALGNLQIALKSQGADFSHVAKITIYTTSITEFSAPEAATVRAKFFGDLRPASTLVQIQQLARPEFKVEIEAIAALP